MWEGTTEESDWDWILGDTGQNNPKYTGDEQINIYDQIEQF